MRSRFAQPVPSDDRERGGDWPDSLDAAWAEAMAARKGRPMRIALMAWSPDVNVPGPRCEALAYVGTGNGGEERYRGAGPTLAAAVRTLAAKLRGER